MLHIVILCPVPVPIQSIHPLNLKFNLKSSPKYQSSLFRKSRSENAAESKAQLESKSAKNNKEQSQIALEKKQNKRLASPVIAPDMDVNFVS